MRALPGGVMPQRFDLVQDGAPDRGGLVRMALLFTPLAGISGGGVAWLGLLLVGGEVGALIGLTVVGLVLFATGYQARAALRDLRAAPVATTGAILRKRRPGIFLWLGRTHYLRLAEGAFVVSVPAYHELEEGDEVEIDHWPHTHRVIRVRLLRRAADVAVTRSALAAPSGRDGGEAEGGAGKRRDDGWRPPHLR